jgi:hypothetical protein
MKPKVKQFIETYIEAIEDDILDFVFINAAEELSTDELYELADVLEGINIPTEEVRWKIFDDGVDDYIQGWLAAPSWQKDKSNSWARVDYMLEEISDLGFGWQEAKEHVIANANKYGTTIRKLAPEYGWMGDGDYAFEWFNPVEFDREYNYE